MGNLTSKKAAKKGKKIVKKSKKSDLAPVKHVGGGEAGHKAQTQVHPVAWDKIEAMAKKHKIRPADLVREAIYEAISFDAEKQARIDAKK